MHRRTIFSSSVYFLVLFLVLHQVSSTNPKDTATSFAKAESSSSIRPAFPFPNPQPSCDPQYVVIPQYTVGSGSIFGNEPSVAIFTSTFLDVVHSTEILRQVCDLSDSPAKDYADFVREYTYASLIVQAIPNAAAIAEWVSRCITPIFDVLTFPIVSKAYANVAANFLYVDGDLTVDNAENLALKYAQSMADAANVIMNSHPASKFLSLVTGYGNFLLEILQYADAQEFKDKAILVAFYVGNEWCVAAANYRWK